MRKDLLLIGIVVATLILMVIPLNQAIIDSLLAVNMTLAVLLLMVALYLKHPSDFSTFPSVILIGTAFRLALSVGTTRLILSEADAGQIIETFGDFVVSGSVAIGLVIFAIITVVQFLVVTKGAERVAEVGARFALDALPGKQLSIDAELRAGNLSAELAAEKRNRLDRDSQFFGAMDGAMKFVKGDAIAGMIIICINLLGGIAVGITVHGYSFGEAFGIFALLTVGDGLVAQIPALLMSLCAGIIVTRVVNAENQDLGSDIFAELVSDTRVPAIAALIVLCIGFIPGFPTLIFMSLSAILVTAAFMLRRKYLADEISEKSDVNVGEDSTVVGEMLIDLPVSTRVSLKLGRELQEDVDLPALEEKIIENFEGLYAARGVRFPRPAVVVGARGVHARQLVVELDEVPVLRHDIPINMSIYAIAAEIFGATNSGQEKEKQKIDWPGFQGIWVAHEERNRMEALGMTPIELSTAFAHMVFRVYERNLGALFTNTVAEQFLAEAREIEPKTMAMIDEDSTMHALHRTLRYLVEDGVPLRPIALLMPQLHYWMHANEKPTSVILAECLRGSMKRQLCQRITGSEGVLGVAMVDPGVETLARQAIGSQKQSLGDAANEMVSFSPEVADELLSQFRALSDPTDNDTQQVAIVVSADLRRRFRNYLAANDIHLPVLSPHEIATEVPTFPVAFITPPQVSLPPQRSKPLKKRGLPSSRGRGSSIAQALPAE